VQGQISEIAALNKRGLDAALDVAAILTDGWERLGRLHLEAAKSLLRESVDTSRGLLSSGSVGDWTPKIGAVVAASAEKAVGYSRNLYDIAAGTSVQLLELLSATGADLRKGWIGVLEGFSESVAMGANTPTSAALKSAAMATDAILDGLTRTAKQSIELADSTLKAAASAASAVKAPTPAKG
jgi:phasin family protein